MIQLYIGAAALVFSVFAGWQGRSIYQDSIELGKIEVLEELKRDQQDGTRVIIEELQGFRANETIIERETVKVIKSPVYNVSCIDADGVRVLERYASGDATSTIDKVP